MKADLLRIETMSHLEMLSRTLSSLRNELSVVEDDIFKMQKELINKENNPKWYNYSCEYDLKIYEIKKRELILKIDEIETIIDDMFERGDIL